MATDTATTTRIGFVGLGNMGGNMATRFLTAGYPVYGEERSRAHADHLVQHGLQWRDTPREVAEAVEMVITSLPDERVRAHGGTMLDAPVSGSVPQVQAGALTIMVGGDERAYATVEPILRELGSPTHIGENGHGLVLKLAINISLAVQMLAFAEGLLLAERGGIDPGAAGEVMAGSPIGSPMLKARLPLILDLPDEAWFDVGLMQKDIVLALEAARELGVPLPSAAAADEMLTLARAHGHEHHDLAALFQTLRQLAGERLRAPT